MVICLLKLITNWFMDSSQSVKKNCITLTEEIKTIKNVNKPLNFQIGSFESNLGKNAATKVTHDLQGKLSLINRSKDAGESFPGKRADFSSRNLYCTLSLGAQNYWKIKILCALQFSNLWIDRAIFFRHIFYHWLLGSKYHNLSLQFITCQTSRNSLSLERLHLRCPLWQQEMIWLLRTCILMILKIPVLTWDIGIQSLTKKLFVSDTFLENEHKFSPMEWHWVSQPQSKESPILKSSWPTQKYTIWFCYFLFYLFISSSWLPFFQWIYC